jgi:hypothetical protein
MREEERVETSVPVQARVSLVDLAVIDRYWIDSGYEMRSMSQLVGWSVSLLVEILRASGKIRGEMGASEAHRHLSNRVLFQKSLKKRAMKKIGAAITFENLRREGVRPEDYVRKQYNVLHNKSSVRPMEMEVRDVRREEMVAAATKRYKEIFGDQPVKVKMTDEELEMKAREIEERDRAAHEAEEEFMKQFGGGNLPTQGQ